MNNKFIFVHVPKTAGTSFIKTLDQKYGDFTCRDYGGKSSKKNHIDRRGFENCDIIYGHFKSDKYKHLNRPQISIIREPTERVISEYFFKKYKTKNIIDYLMRKKEVSRPKIIYDNVIHEYIQDINRFKFIGLTERFDETIQRFNKILGINLPKTSFHSKRNPNKKRVSKEERQFIKNFCKKDYEIYNAVLNRWWKNEII
jgi:hypothetical protein